MISRRAGVAVAGNLMMIVLALTQAVGVGARIGTVLLNIVLSPVLMFGWLGAPALGASLLRLSLFVPAVLWWSRQPGFALHHIWYLSVATLTVHVTASLTLLHREFGDRGLSGEQVWRWPEAAPEETSVGRRRLISAGCRPPRGRFRPRQA